MEDCFLNLCSSILRVDAPIEPSSSSICCGLQRGCSSQLAISLNGKASSAQDPPARARQKPAGPAGPCSVASVLVLEKIACVYAISVIDFILIFALQQLRNNSKSASRHI